MKNITYKKIQKAGAMLALVLTLTFSAGVRLDAYSIEQLKNVGASGDYVVGPGKQELKLKPGETKTVPLTVTNRTGETRTFEINFEDIAGSQDLQETVKLLGETRGEYSLKDFLSVAEKSFVLKQGEQAVIPVKVLMPENAEAGGKYGSVVVSTVSAGAGTGNGTAIVSRIGTLFFVTVEGDALSEGRVSKFETLQKKHFFLTGPVDFQVLFENNGNVHLNPYGEIDITNISGDSVERMVIDPWFTLPGSVRSREIAWSNVPAWGIYKATARINRGYGDIVDEKTVTIIIVSTKAIAIAVALVAVLTGAVLMRRRLKKVTS